MHVLGHLNMTVTLEETKPSPSRVYSEGHALVLVLCTGNTVNPSNNMKLVLLFQFIGRKVRHGKIKNLLKFRIESWNFCSGFRSYAYHHYA